MNSLCFNSYSLPGLECVDYYFKILMGSSEFNVDRWLNCFLVAYPSEDMFDTYLENTLILVAGSVYLLELLGTLAISLVTFILGTSDANLAFAHAAPISLIKNILIISF